MTDILDGIQAVTLAVLAINVLVMAIVLHRSVASLDRMSNLIRSLP